MVLEKLYGKLFGFCVDEESPDREGVAYLKGREDLKLKENKTLLES